MLWVFQRMMLIPPGTSDHWPIVFVKEGEKEDFFWGEIRRIQRGIRKFGEKEA